jgi:RecA/RadA recombinase
VVVEAVDSVVVKVVVALVTAHFPHKEQITALKQTKDTFVGSGESQNFLGVGFNRETMNQHLKIMQDMMNQSEKNGDL